MNYDESAEVIIIDSNLIVYTTVLQFLFLSVGYTSSVQFVLFLR